MPVLGSLLVKAGRGDRLLGAGFTEDGGLYTRLLSELNLAALEQAAVAFNREVDVCPSWQRSPVSWEGPEAVVQNMGSIAGCLSTIIVALCMQVDGQLGSLSYLLQFIW